VLCWGGSCVLVLVRAPCGSEMTEREKGAFVYKGAGKRTKMSEDAPPEQRLCDTYHVAMQRCLAARNHQERWCQEEIRAWKKCFEDQRALDGRAREGLPDDGPLQKARQKLDPARYDKQGRPLKK